jgi:hypothetical protein
MHILEKKITRRKVLRKFVHPFPSLGLQVSTDVVFEGFKLSATEKSRIRSNTSTDKGLTWLRFYGEKLQPCAGKVAT